VAEADLASVRYLATLLHAADQDVLRYFILAIAQLLDPAAVLLLLLTAKHWVARLYLASRRLLSPLQEITTPRSRPRHLVVQDSPSEKANA
jgi:hypothetical protein